MNPHNLDAEQLYAQLEANIKSALIGTENLAIVGIYSGGAWLAERLAKALGVAELGYLDVAFYRDDYSQRGLSPEVRPSHMPFEVEGATILLVDDVLYTGRTTRAAINTLFDYGRPERILLAALLDRGGRQLPIAADFVAANVSLEAGQQLVLQQTEDHRLLLSIDHA
jgi:pyrimidine operon attenuation protein/uracil phosphoribosyltransferase